jgi:hypothetical protein
MPIRRAGMVFRQKPNYAGCAAVREIREWFAARPYADFLSSTGAG